MPLYEYRCTKCGKHMEVLQKFSDRPRRRCPECSGKLEKMISRTSFLLKGGGWYDQGYGRSSGGRSTGDSGSSSSSSSSGSSSSGSSSTSGSSSSGSSSGGKTDSGKNSSDSGSKASSANA